MSAYKNIRDSPSGFPERLSLFAKQIQLFFPFNSPYPKKLRFLFVSENNPEDRESAPYKSEPVLSSGVSMALDIAVMEAVSPLPVSAATAGVSSAHNREAAEAMESVAEAANILETLFTDSLKLSATCFAKYRNSM